MIGYLIVFLLSFFTLNGVELTEPEPYKSIKALPTNLNGFFDGRMAACLEIVVNEIHPKVIVELGSWLGTSAVFLAQKTDDETKVYAVDHWLGSQEHQSTPIFSKMLPTLYQQFLSNVKNVGLVNKIIPARMTTLEAARSLNIRPDMVYVDASHDAESVYQDIMAWYAKLNSNGIMCGDDFNWPSVAKGVMRAAKALKQTVHAKGGDEPFWSFGPKK